MSEGEYDPHPSDEQVRRLKKSDMVKMAVACHDVSEALGYIGENDAMMDEIVNRVLSETGRVDTEQTVREIIRLTLNDMQRRAGMVRSVEPEQESDTEGKTDE